MRFAMRALDTTSEADQLQLRIQRRLGPAGRLKLAMQMSDLARKLARAGLRARRRELEEAAVDALLLREHYGVGVERR